MSDFESFLEEQMKSEEFRREFEALAPDYELVLRGDVDPRNLCYPIKMDGTHYNEYECGYNDGVIAAYWLTRSAKAMDAEPVVHAHWITLKQRPVGSRHDHYCSACGQHGTRDYVRCPGCGAHMDEEVADA